MHICLITKDAYLFRYTELILGKKARVSSEYDDSADLVIYDCESGIKLPDSTTGIIKVSRSSADDTVPIPFPHTFLTDLIAATDEKPPLCLSDDGKRAFVKGKSVKLSAHEFRLLELLIRSGDDYTSREKIAKEVWGEASNGLINIYIHYLREKLETNDEKIIVSSRKYGYKISSAYLSPKSVSIPNEKGDTL